MPQVSNVISNVIARLVQLLTYMMSNIKSVDPLLMDQFISNVMQRGRALDRMYRSSTEMSVSSAYDDVVLYDICASDVIVNHETVADLTRQCEVPYSQVYSSWLYFLFRLYSVQYTAAVGVARRSVLALLSTVPPPLSFVSNLLGTQVTSCKLIKTSTVPVIAQSSRSLRSLASVVGSNGLVGSLFVSKLLLTGKLIVDVSITHGRFIEN